MGGKHRGGRKIPLRFPHRCHGRLFVKQNHRGQVHKKTRSQRICGLLSAFRRAEKAGFRFETLQNGHPRPNPPSQRRFSKTERQEGDEALPLSFLNEKANNSRVCHLTYTTPQTKELILRHKDKAPVYNGSINGVGPRYCPSIEDKVIRFADKERHQIFWSRRARTRRKFIWRGCQAPCP